MIAVNNESGCWPTQNQERLLRAALLKGDSALQAWSEWKRHVNIDILDYGSHRMIPQLYRNLLDHGVKDPLMARFKGVYRYYLYKNQFLLHQASGVLRAFRDAGISTMALKGAAIISLYNKEPALRPMEDLDVLVPTKQSRAAMSLLRTLGWKPVFSPPERWIPILHSTPFKDSSGRQIDLHWHLLWECWNACDSDYWESAIPITVDSAQTLTLGPTHLLLHTCWHGVRWNEVPPIRWIADAVAILNDERTVIDWNLLIEKAQRHHISLPLKDSLAYLRNLLGAPVPPSVIKSLHDLPISSVERTSYGEATNPTVAPNTATILRLLYYDYLWLTSSTSLRFKSFAFVRHLQHKWNIAHLWQLPFYLSFRTVLKAFKRSSRYNSRRPQSFSGPADGRCV
jgi:putative nucleotidyltransferase-like protein